MNISKASEHDYNIVQEITVDTINEIYPRYYPMGAVRFFLKHHSPENIMSDIKGGIVYLLIDNNKAVGTVTIRNNEICRLFVLPEHQKKGYGGRLIAYAEKLISESCDSAVLDASLPAKEIYMKKGYSVRNAHSIKTDNGDYLCYDVMEKPL
ncbi:MAG: GNAT family N-acetyltransferase [Oscillospiraceae bacterium]|nr:GNAT family N-acetyltransferase [Oscillospiraceae bacterium]